MSATLNSNLFASYFGQTCGLFLDAASPLQGTTMCSADAPPLGVDAASTSTPIPGIGALRIQDRETDLGGVDQIPPAAADRASDRAPDRSVVLAGTAAVLDGGVAPTIHIPGFTFPVTEYWLEDVLEATGHLIEQGSKYAKKSKQAEFGGEGSHSLTHTSPLNRTPTPQPNPHLASE